MNNYNKNFFIYKFFNNKNNNKKFLQNKFNIKINALKFKFLISKKIQK